MSNKYTDVFLGAPWTGKCNTWPGVTSNNDGSTISNYFQFPIPAIDPPSTPTLAGQFRGPGSFVSNPANGFMTGGKRRTKKVKRKYVKSKVRKNLNSIKCLKSKKNKKGRNKRRKSKRNRN